MTPPTAPAEDFSQRDRTFRLEMLRALPQGVVETAATTFALFVAIRDFGLPPWQKAAIVASSSLGLLLSLFLVQLVRRLGWPVNRTGAALWTLSGAGFAVAAASDGRSAVYFAGVCAGLGTLMTATPLMAQIYRKHYPQEVRGRLFSYAGLVRATVAALAGWLGGMWLEAHDFGPLFAGFAVACLVMAGCVLAMAPVHLRRSNRLQWFDAFGHAFADRPFRKLLVSWMFLGLGNLTAIAVFVEYVSNPAYGRQLGAAEVGMLTSTVPMAAFILTIVPWGNVFDRLPFYRVRTLVNVAFIAGILLFYLGGGWWALVAGMAIHGAGKAGGNVLWSLWVTRFGDAERATEYMSVHTFLTGLRGMVAPALGFWLIGAVGPAAVAWTGAGLLIAGTLILAPEVRAEFAKGRAG